jgi:ubiquinone/menaquinone biosynthesis C-methylase UbiE
MQNQRLFDKYRDGNHWEKHPTLYAEVFVRFLKKHFTKQILSSEFLITDLGCGNGRDIMYFAKTGISCMGIDIHANVKELIDPGDPLGQHHFLLGQTIESLPIRSNSHYAYFCINVMHYVNQQKVLSEIYRTLYPGGYAFIHFNLLIVDENCSIDYHQKKSDVYKLLKKFEIVEETVFIREDKLPLPHTHHIMQVILKKT